MAEKKRKVSGTKRGKVAKSKAGTKNRKKESKKKKGLEEEIRKLRKKYKIVGTKEAAEFIRKNLKLKFKGKSIENQIIKKKIGKVVSVKGRKLRVFTSADVGKLKKLYESYKVGDKLKKKYAALGIKDLLSTLKKKYKIDTNAKRLETLVSRLARKNKIKRKYENYMGRKVLAFTKDAVEKIVSHIKAGKEKKGVKRQTGGKKKQTDKKAKTKKG